MFKHKVLSINILFSLFLIQVSASGSQVKELQVIATASSAPAAGTSIPELRVPEIRTVTKQPNKPTTKPRCLRLRSLVSCTSTRAARNNQTPQIILVPVSVHSNGQDEPCHCKCDCTHLDCGNCDCECGDCGDGSHFDSYDND